MITNRFDRMSSAVGSILTGLLACVVLIAVAGLAAAQAPSTDRDNPTQLTASEIKGDGVEEKTEYFYSFTAGPGDVTITLDVKAEQSTAVSSVDIALFNAGSKKLLSTYANPDHGSSKHAVETATVHGTQTLLLQVEVSTGVSSFKIKLAGAVAINSGTGQGGGSAALPQPDSTEPATDSNLASVAVEPLSFSQDQNNPTPLETRLIKGGSVTEKTKYFCTFMAGPGKVSLKLNVKSKKKAAVSSVDLELFDGDSKYLASGFANPSLGDSKQQTLTANLDSKQKVVLTITVSTGVDNYSLGVAGAVGINDAASLRPVIDLRPMTAVTTAKAARSKSPDRP
ncbi:MAG: hypothetical protein QOF72_1743 [Blastocatellia bacterium]|jgi:hypothetical protein|nr:hypothetical protein [Blastocatellia bacterium]